MSRDRLLKLLDSGELHRLASTAKSERELAERVGMTHDAYESVLRRYRRSGGEFPRFHELVADTRKAPQQGADFPAHGRKIGSHSPTPPSSEPLEIDIEDFVMDESMGDNEFADEPTKNGKDEKPPWTIASELDARKERIQYAATKAKLAQVLEALEQCQLELSVATEAKEARKHVEPIRPRESSGLLREATAVALASDWHIEELVDPVTVNGVNAYNIDIAKHRAERFFSGFEYLIRYHQDHFAIRDALLWLGGDLITGYLREENLESNELSPTHAIATLHVWLAAGIRRILASSDIDLLKVVCNSGNHGRLTDKVRPSTREHNSIEWLMYNMLAREFEDEPRVQFTLPHGSHTYVEVYDWTIRFLHGDDVNFKGGVGGITVPLYKALARWETFRRADLTCLGHFHQYHDMSDLVVNGSLIGYNPYALSIGARYEEPRQAFFLIDSKRGKTFPADIWVTESKGKRKNY